MDEISNIVTKLNYCDLLQELDQKDIKNCEVSLVGSGLCGGLNHTSELQVMNYKEAITGPKCKA